MKTIRWIGIAFLTSAAAIAAFLMIGQPSEAAVGDPIVISDVTPVTLTSPQRTCYRNWLTATVPNVQATLIDELRCEVSANNTVTCHATDENDWPAAQYWTDSVEHGRIASEVLPEHFSVDGTTVHYRRYLGHRVLTSAELTSLNLCHASAFSPLDPTLLTHVTLRRSGSNITGTARRLETIPAATAVTRRKAGETFQVVGVVQ